MQRYTQIHRAISGGGKKAVPQSLRKPQEYVVGVDIGSTSSDVVVLTKDRGEIVLCDYRRTLGRPIETIKLQFQQVFERIGSFGEIGITVTGAAGRFLAKLLGVAFVNEVSAQASAVSFLYPDIQKATIIEMGGQDSKLIFLSNRDRRVRVQDFATNSVCAAGTGSFLD